ncbi:MAG: hypothetical protein K2X77_19000 [Candidatus Obscuribacterales bacterium]|nr:hypothetical protein [Candidatus Obscuribacterales bacterium]
MSQQLSQQSPALAPLSRDHLLAIQQAKVLQRASRSSVQDQDNVVQNLAMFWKEEMEPHFLNEERILQQFIADKELWNKLVEDHRIICNLTKRIIFSDEIRCSELLQLGELIERHYVWEDEVLFPYLLKSLDNNSQIRLLHQTHIWEAVRSRNQKSH